MARPRIEIAEETQDLAWQLKEEGKTLKQIAGQTGLRYNITQRLLSQPRASTNMSPNLGHQRLVANVPTINPSVPPHSQNRDALPNVTTRNYSSPNAPPRSRRLQPPEPENETIRYLRTRIAETKLSRQLLEEMSAEKRALKEFIDIIYPVKKAPVFQPKPGAVLYEYSEDTFREIEANEMKAAKAFFKNDAVAISKFHLLRRQEWRARSFKIVHVEPTLQQVHN